MNGWIRTAVRATMVVACALTVASVTGTASAQAATAAPTSSTAAGNAVLVKEVRNANGVLDIYKVTNTGLRLDSSSGCAGGSLHVCLNIAGHGLYVDVMENYTTFPSAGTVNMRISGPNGFMTESGNFPEYGGDYVFHWLPHRNVTGGYYCATSFTYTTSQAACGTVHS
ncbi:hypothetical protein Lfu02_78880 [Longispora fulva]|uniref:Secreted protein n=1 Tax=Longispora fulva TaxID=619741 RepID=A0A8J7G6V0_9ACTN|nr:hypothetical protein [Longispora fulva]MBG6134015.1 hypothetical protein [Longispora fulva]GIG63516.1 hypothetical protein Lfu02_78880 [Longispora fulva]